ncbi:helix-turn-helix transcriptional regulator [Micromonospora sp. NPDC048986]|uniref:helix-turn-helix domain-containing protein n=1 Tax=Micromonospora sp. NPDC048986 TaxID=3155644 RepID=UPI0033FA3AB8
MTEPQHPHPEVNSLLNITDPAERVKQATTLIETYQALINDDIGPIRREALKELISSGLNQTEVGEKVGMTRARIGQILSSGPRPERAFLGTGNVLTIAVGGKEESGRTDGSASAMMSRGASDAYGILAELARSLGLKPQPVEIVAPPGHVDLNRPGLIVLCGPRLLPFVGQVLGADPKYGFVEDATGNYLIDRETGTEYRSPADSGVSTDYAYVGRLPRPDGKGTFLYLAGIHAAGTKGAARYVEANLESLWKDHKTRRFSGLVECRYDAKMNIIEATPLTKFHRHEGVN